MDSNCDQDAVNDLPEENGRKRKLDDKTVHEPESINCRKTVLWRDEFQNFSYTDHKKFISRVNRLMEMGFIKSLDGLVVPRIDILNRSFSWEESDRVAAKVAVYLLARHAIEEQFAEVMVKHGAIPALVKHLRAPPSGEGDQCEKHLEHQVEEGSAAILTILAKNPEYQQLIVDSGAITHLVSLLKRHKAGPSSRSLNDVTERAAEAISQLAWENSSVQIHVRMEGGIPLLVELLDVDVINVQGAAARALRILAKKNNENKDQIVECGALPTLAFMLKSKNDEINYVALSTLLILVDSSKKLTKHVMNAGALQPIIRLLGSSSMRVQKQAASLLAELAAAYSDRKAIVQRGAVRPLIGMLQSPNVKVREMSTLALRRLAQDKHNQAGIAHEGGLLAFLGLLDSESGPLQAAAASVLECLMDNEDNLSEFIIMDGFRMLQHVKFTSQAVESCVARTLKSLKNKIHGRALKDLVYLMQASKKAIRERISFALAHLSCPIDHQMIFLDKSGLELLLGLLTSSCPQQQLDGGVALLTLAKHALCLSPVDAAPPVLPPQVNLRKQYKKKTMPSDVTFWVEGEQFYAHKFFLSASSDAFRAMFDGNYREKDATNVEIPNIKREVFAAMMRFTYTGSVDVTLDIAEDLLRAADQYLMEELKRFCQHAIEESLSLENIAAMLELSEDAHATSLKKSCILFILEHFDEFRQRYSHLIQGIVLVFRDYFSEELTKWTSMQEAKHQSH
ncbi:ARM REPEAT PROTEIN INTERACTING WITH ABF2-like [Syzygium oleosum]|uniref:ARM REPEAT PROTEIN INTERACTING WITH ABF2-like n=1 Tax=Syzygium oleosum TaxID=219896 RepID=UPI0024B98475|nr:ARM REPEAT PROTEIN INTERACTING WITH ABF2-like [Syzygium oleosum]